MDEQDLNVLGFTDFSQLRSQVDDFADMFVKTPGHIHNFKHVNWIDFIACADSTETPKVIISTSSKNFKCNLEIKTAFLSDEPSSKAFLVYLNNVRELTEDEHGNFSEDMANHTVTPVVAPVIQTATVEEKSETITPTQEDVKEIKEQLEKLNDKIDALR